MRSSKRAIAGVVGIGAATAAYGWVAGASAVYCWGMDKWDAYVFPYTQWVQAVPWRNYSPVVRTWVTIGAVAPTVALLASGALAVVGRMRRKKLARPFGGGVRPVEPGVTDNHGHSQWRSMKDAIRLFPGPNPIYGGYVVGEAYRVDEDTVARIPFNPRDRSTWGKGGKAPLLIDPCEGGSTHNIIIAGPGGFKSTSAVTSILHWTGSSVILDPSRELGPMLDGALRAQGKRVFHIGINSPGDLLATGTDVVKWIDPGHPEAEMHVRSVVGIIYDEDAAKNGQGSRSEDPFFMPMGRNLVTCLLAHMLWDTDRSERTLAVLGEGLSLPAAQLLHVLAGIHQTSKSPMARRLAAVLLDKSAPETWLGIYMNAVNGTAWLFTSAYADVVSRGAFNPEYLLDGNTTVFLNISLQTLENTPALARVLVGALLNTVYMADGNLKGRVLFLLDEAARLGHMKILETARDAGRKYRITLSLLFQSMGQIVDIWGKDGARSWIDACSWIGYAAIRAGGAGKELSEQLGTHGVMAYSEGENTGRNSSSGGFGSGSSSRGSNVSAHEIKRALMTASQMQQDMREDEIIIVPGTGMPIRCGRAIYFRRPDLDKQVQQNRFAKAQAA